MTAHFTIASLGVGELGEAWPIVRASGAHANEDWWISEAAQLIAGGGGVLVARAPDGYLHAVASFELPRATGQRTLVVRTLITFELSANEPARTALLAALKRIATKLECSHVTFPLARTVRPRVDVPSEMI